MSYLEYYFVGDPENPLYLIEINKEAHRIVVSTPDKHSKKAKVFFERYYLGDILYDIKYESIIYQKDDLHDYTKLDGKMGEGSFILSECIIKTKKKYLWIKDDILETE